MPRRRRADHAPSYFHVVHRAEGRTVIFRRPPDYNAFVTTLRDGLERYPLRLVSYCLLSNHWQLILGPAGPKAVSQLVRWVATTHSVRWRRRHRPAGTGAVYECRFTADPIASLDGLMHACRGVERLALTAGLVDRAQDWPWTSLAGRLMGDRTLPIADTPFLVSQLWIDYVNAPRAAAAAVTISGDLAEEPATGGLERRQRLVDLPGRDDQNQADAHVERPKRLGVLKPARMRQPRKQRRDRPARAVK